MTASQALNRIVTAFLLLVWSLAALAQSPNAVVEEAADLLDQKLNGRREELAADQEALYALINDILLPRFDRQYAARLVLGKHWRTASEEQKERFIAAFYDSLLRKYADGVLEFDAGQFEILEYRGDPSKPRTIVKTIVRLKDGTKVPVNYGMVKRDEGWMMFDVTVEGISYVRNYRAEINSEILSGSLESVIQRLEADAKRNSKI